MEQTENENLFLKAYHPVTLCNPISHLLRAAGHDPLRPPQTPQTWLQIQPYAEIHVGSQTIIFVQPSTPAIVYLLGILTVGIGIYFLIAWMLYLGFVAIPRTTDLLQA